VDKWVKVAFFAMDAYKPALLDFLCGGFATVIASLGFQEPLSKWPT
jgi:hypothetical protein